MPNEPWATSRTLAFDTLSSSCLFPAHCISIFHRNKCKNWKRPGGPGQSIVELCLGIQWTTTHSSWDRDISVAAQAAVNLVPIPVSYNKAGRPRQTGPKTSPTEPKQTYPTLSHRSELTNSLPITDPSQVNPTLPYPALLNPNAVPKAAPNPTTYQPLPSQPNPQTNLARPPRAVVIHPNSLLIPPNLQLFPTPDPTIQLLSQSANHRREALGPLFSSAEFFTPDPRSIVLRKERFPESVRSGRTPSLNGNQP